MTDQRALFSEFELRHLIEEQRAKMYQSIDAYDGDRLLNTSPTDLAEHFAAQFRIEPVELLHRSTTVSQTESKVEARYGVIDPSRPVFVPAITVTWQVPYTGDPITFRCQARYSSLPPRAQVSSGQLHISLVLTDHDASATRAHFDRELDQIRKHLGWNDQLLRPFNAALGDNALEYLTRRRERLLANRNLVANLGFPLQARGDAATYTPPEIRRKVRATPRAASNQLFVPEPALSMRDYEHVLELVLTAARMIERNPSTFGTMAEEDLRNQFLIVLNTHYEGQATGETFNAGGKTDILVRSKDRSIFIAECKIWRGKKSLLDAVDQLLSYTTWRDTKTAVVIFNRNRNVSQVVAKVPLAMEEHPQFKRPLQTGLEGGYRCLMSHEDDPNRELVLTVLVIDIPDA